jgi:hypothetical protein
VKNEEPETWIAHSESDRDSARLLSEGLDRQRISVLNDYIEYRLRSGEDERDVVTQSISRADHVLALISPNTNAEDVISQMRRARCLHKAITVVFVGNCQWASPPVSSTELVELLSGCPHVYYAAKRTFVDLVARIKQPAPEEPDRPLPQTDAHTHYGVFMSKKSEDYPLAKRVYDFLRSKGANVFLSEESLPAVGSAEYMKAIDAALEQAEHLVVVGSKADNLLSGWVEAEWRVFINEKRSGRKQGNVVTVLCHGLTPDLLPMSLRYYEAVPLTEEGLARLAQYVTSASSK